MSISYSIPAYLSNFTTSEDGRTVAKLKAYYVGETADGRVFSQEFAEKLMKTLPNCPIVGFYSDIKDDFCGHNSTQYIYGIVPADAVYGFEKDDNGVDWMITDVLLYTDRVDNIGQIAEKIVGHPHSLEMHPDNTKYEIRMENGKRKIYFTEGSLIGLSVLAMNEKPAFTGSEFFKENTEVREKFENFISFLENKDRGASMNKEQFEKLYSFITLSYQEKEEAIYRAANQQVGDDAYAIVEQCYDDYCVLLVYDFASHSTYYKKASYTIDENNQVVFGDFVTVYPRFVTEEEVNAMKDSAKSEPEFADNKDDDDKDDKDDENEDPKDKNDEDDDKEDDKFIDENNNDTSEGVVNESQSNFQEEQLQQENITSNFTALTDSEREEFEKLKKDFEQLTNTNQKQVEELENLRLNLNELEQFRLEKRINLVNSYAEEMSAETISAFKEMAKTSSYEELEAKLAIEFVKISKENKKQNSVAFSISGLDFGYKANSDNSYEALVKRYSNK